MVYRLNSIKFKDKVVGTQSAYWKMMEDCFSNIHALSARYLRAKGYFRPNFHPSEAPVFKEVEFMFEAVPCFKCGGPHFQSGCMKNKNYTNDTFQTIGKLTILTSFGKIILTVVNSLQATYHFLFYMCTAKW